MAFFGTPRVACAVAICLLIAQHAAAADWFVAAGAAGSGSSASPFGRIQDALNAAQPGDSVIIRPGTYNESLTTVRNGASGAPISLRAQGERGSVLVTRAGRVLTVNHAYVIVSGLVLDGQYGANDAVRISSGGNNLVFRNNEVRRSTQDLIDMGGPADVLIEDCLIHHALNAANGRTDAHGIAAGPVRNLTIRNSEIHTFSGDGFQVDPGRSSPGWSGVTVEGVRFWLAPLPTSENGFPAGTVTGENAIDTKASASLPRATLTIRNTTASGFRNGLITNMAAFNVKEHVAATLDRITVFDSEIAFRLRGGGSGTTGAWVTLTNAVVYDVLTGFRYEDNIQNLRIWNNTVGRGVTRAFQAASSTRTGLDVRNLLVLGSRPTEAASSASNLAVTDQAFVNAAAHDYRLAARALAIDAGVTLPEVAVDRIGVARPVGAYYDVGAYEWLPGDTGVVIFPPRR